MTILIFTFDDGNGTTYHNVYAESSNPTLINALQFTYSPGQPVFPTYNNGDPVGSPACQGTTLISYVYLNIAPFAMYTSDYNSSLCGYVPPSCDLALSTLSHTNETSIGANDGTINVFATTSSLPIIYQLIGTIVSNNTGYFTGVSVGTYEIAISDGRGCIMRGIFVTIQPFDTTKTRCKYELSFADIKSGTLYALSFLYQKAQFDPLVYPLQLTGTDNPLLRKTTNSNEDKTEAFAPSSLTINVLANGLFDVAEFADSQERDWKVELYKKQVAIFPPSNFTGTLTEATTPDFIDGGLQLKNNGNIVYNITSSGTQSATIPVGMPYSIEAYTSIAPLGPNAKIRLQIHRGATIIFDKQIPSIIGASMVKTGVVQNEAYTISVTTYMGISPVTTIDIDDNSDPFLVLDWQGWLLPDELQDFYADNNYAISMIATDGLLSLKGITFGDLSRYYLDVTGIKHLYQLSGLNKWVYLVKICLDQLGYNYGNTTILSSLTYTPVDNNWLNYAVWADLFYDTNGSAKDTYSALEILLKGMHLQIFQDKGSFVLWDINDVVYRNSTPAALQLYCFETDLVSTLTQGVLPSNQSIGANQINKPTNPMQSLNYDKAFNQLEADVSFTLLSLLYPNPSFEINAIQGELPDGFTTNGNPNIFVNYDPQNPLDPNIGAYSGDWELTSQLVYSGGYNFTNYIRPNPKWVVDQPNMKVNFSYYWRAHYLGAGYENSLPVTLLVFYGISGTNYSWYVPASGTPAWTTGSEPYSHTASPNVHVTDYNAWNNFSITTDVLPEISGQLEVRIGAPSFYFAGSFPPNGTFFRADIDAMQITLSDASDPYNFQTGENHVVTNVTSYAKSEKKTIALELFTYPGNKRTSGNVSYGSDYATSKMTNEWKFALSVEQVADRLPANIVRRFAKNYQRPMYKFQGDIISGVANYYSVWVLKGYETKIFIAFTIEMDLRNATGNIVLIEIDDIQMQSFYQYTPVYSKSARNNLA